MKKNARITLEKIRKYYEKRKKTSDRFDSFVSGIWLATNEKAKLTENQEGNLWGIMMSLHSEENLTVLDEITVATWINSCR